MSTENVSKEQKGNDVNHVLAPVNIVETGDPFYKRYCHNLKKCEFQIPCDTGYSKCPYLKSYPITNRC